MEWNGLEVEWNRKKNMSTVDKMPILTVLIAFPFSLSSADTVSTSKTEATPIEHCTIKCGKPKKKTHIFPTNSSVFESIKFEN